MRVGIIGYGSMGKMLLNKFSKNDIISKDNLLVSNRTTEKLREVDNISTILNNKEVARNADILFLCIKPVDYVNVLNEIKDSIKKDSLVISLNGSISFKTIHKSIDNKLAKVIPSLTAEINRSNTLVCFDELVLDNDKLHLKELLKSFGNVIELSEDEMGMGSELVSCMPGFIASIFDTITIEAEKHTSIPKDEIIKMVLSTLSATADLMIKNNMTFKDVTDRVSTKGGITIEGTNVIYEKFPKIANELFIKTLEKRKETKEKVEEEFNK